MNKRMLSMITALIVAAGAFGTADARTVPANLGTAAIGSQVSRFIYSPFTGAVTATAIPAGTFNDWELGLPIDTFGGKLVSVTSRAVTAGATWQAMSNNAAGTMFSASAVANIPVSGSYMQLTRFVLVPVGGVLWLHAAMNSGASINRIIYKQ